VKLVTIDNLEVNPDEVGAVWDSKDGTARPTVILIQGAEHRVSLTVAEVKRLLTEAK
jgi:hypothetical protein